MAALKILKANADTVTGLSRLRLELVLAPNEFVDSRKLFKLILKKVKRTKK